MTQIARNYARVLHETAVPLSMLSDCVDTISQSAELKDALQDPTIKKEDKKKVIDKLFPENLHNFLKVLCDYQHIDQLKAIYDAYEELDLEDQNMVKAHLKYVTKPSDSQLEQIKKMICNKYHKKDVKLQLEQDAALLGGFVLNVYDDEYDNSLLGAWTRLKKHLNGGETIEHN